MSRNSLDVFVSRIKDFHELSSSKQIDYFVYYNTVIKKLDSIEISDIKECFRALNLREYSNISSYLSKNSKGINAKFIKNNGRYKLILNYKVQIDKELGEVEQPKPTSDLFNLDIVANTRGYIEKVANQACVCYDLKLYDACLVMIRKMLETLIIEAFERYTIADKIKGADGNFFYLSDLIPSLLNERSWNISRNASKSIPKIKALGDLSAHNRRFIAKKDDIDKIKDDLRSVIEELVHLVDYVNWK